MTGTRPPAPGRIAEAARRVSPDTWALLAIAGAVLLANLPYLLGVFVANPLGPRSGLLSAFTPGVLRGQPTIDPNNGFISQAVGHRAAHDWLGLHLPWWNPYEATGTPMAGELQSAALFPPTVLTLFSNGQLYEHMLLELVAGASTFLLLRRLSINRWASLAAGIAFALNGSFAWLAHASINPVAFLPMLLLGVELAYSASLAGRRGGWWLIAVAGALSLYAGFPEVAYIDALLGIGWLIWRCACLGRERWVPLARKAVSGAIAAGLVAAPLAIASLGYIDHADVARHGGSYYASAHLSRHALPQLLLPYVYGPIFGFADPQFVVTNIWGKVGGYLGASILLFAFLGLFSKGRRGLRVLLVVWIVLTIARIYHAPRPLGDVLGVLPGMSQVAFYRYAFPSLELAVVILAALGLDGLTRAPAPRRRVVLAGIVTLVLVAIAAIGARPLAHQLGATFTHHRPYFIGSIAWGACAVIAGAVAAMVQPSHVRRWLLGLVVAGEAIALFAIPELSAPRAVQTDTAPVAFLQRHLGQSRFFTLGPLQPNYGSYFGIASLNINDVPLPKVFGNYVHARLDQVVDPRVFVGNLGGGRSPWAPSPQQELLRNLAGYREAGVSYVLTPAGQALPQSANGFKLVFRSPSTWIYHLAGAAPYFTAGAPGCDVRPQSRTSVELSCSRATQLVRRETDLPGWSAHVDGHSARVGRADGLFQTVAVPAGTHRVEFAYAPPRIVWGLAGFILGCIWLLTPAFSRHLRPRIAGWSRQATYRR